MANPFLTSSHEEIETAIMLENAYVTDIGNAVAYTDGARVFINTDENLTKILPDYNTGMLKWLLWHERFHIELKHHKRFRKFIEDVEDEFHVTQKEVNIIMDILVHDSLAKMFPELVPTAKANMSQMRDCNSLGYTFTTKTLEKMLAEYSEYKHSEDKSEDKDEETSTAGEDTSPDEPASTSEDTTSTPPPKTKTTPTPGDDDTPPEEDTPEEDTPEEKEKSSHDEVDWSMLEEIDTDEFIDEAMGSKYVDQINRLKRTKFKFAKLTQTLNGLATTTKRRSYAMPSMISTSEGMILKGRVPGKTSLYLVFDASGSMGAELATFKEIISKSVPQAMSSPCEWFSGYSAIDLKALAYNKHYDGSSSRDYYKGKFKDIMDVRASGGYDDDGDRTIDLCYQAEMAGFTPIGVSDGGGSSVRHYNTMEQLKEMKRTLIVSPNKKWLESINKYNPAIQTIYIE